MIEHTGLALGSFMLGRFKRHKGHYINFMGVRKTSLEYVYLDNNKKSSHSVE